MNLKIVTPIERLKNNYQSYIDDIHKWKTYAVTLLGVDGEEPMYKIKALNPEHLMIEIGQLWHLDNMELKGILYEEIGRYKVTDRQQDVEPKYYNREKLRDFAFDLIKDKVENAPESNELIKEYTLVIEKGFRHFRFRQALEVIDGWDYDVTYEE
jgi:hypothetical protein